MVIVLIVARGISVSTVWQQLSQITMVCTGGGGVGIIILACDHYASMQQDMATLAIFTRRLQKMTRQDPNLKVILI